MRRIAVALALAVVGWSTEARAENEVVGLLDVRGVGVSDVVLETFAEGVEEGLAGAEGFTPAPRDRMREMLSSSSWSVGCTVGPCLAEVRSQTGAGYVVIAGLAGTGESYRFTISLIETERGDVVEQMHETCPACTVEDLASAATLATIELINVLEVEPPPEEGVADAERAALQRRVDRHASGLRRATLLVVGAAVLTAGAAGYFIQKDRTDVGYPLLGATAGLAASGALMFGLSLRF